MTAAERSARAEADERLRRRGITDPVLREAILSNVDAAPELTPEQGEKLRGLFASNGVEQRGPA